MSCSPTLQSYATIEDLQDAGLPPAALEGGPSFSKQLKALMMASRQADTYLRNRYTLPLSCPIDPALVNAVVQIASWRLMSRRGFNPSTGLDVAIRQGYEDAIAFLRGISNGQNQLCVTQAVPESLQPEVATNCNRGYNQGSRSVGPNGWGL